MIGCGKMIMAFTVCSPPPFRRFAPSVCHTALAQLGRSGKIAPMGVSVAEAVPSEREILGQLLELNAYEFSRIDSRAVGPDGRYGCAYLDAYWIEPNRSPYLIRVEQEIAGFALVSRRDNGPTSISEFLILPKFRRAGIGTQAARMLFALHRGAWQVAQVAGNSPATDFWHRAIPVDYAEEINTNGTVVQTFST